MNSNERTRKELVLRGKIPASKNENNTFDTYVDKSQRQRALFVRRPADPQTVDVQAKILVKKRWGEE